MKGSYFWNWDVHIHPNTTVVNELMNNEFEQNNSNSSGHSDGHIHTCTNMQMVFQKPSFHIQEGVKHEIPSTSGDKFFRRHSTVFY